VNKKVFTFILIGTLILVVSVKQESVLQGLGILIALMNFNVAYLYRGGDKNE